MNMIKKIIIIILIIGAIMGTGIFIGEYFKKDILNVYDNLNKSATDFTKSEVIADVISEIKEDISLPPPLKVISEPKQTVLTASQIIKETNLQRQANGGLPGLSEDTRLTSAALAKVNDMFKNQYFEHVSPDGVSPGELVTSYGYEYLATGENLILGNFEDEKEVVQKWIDSPGHRANILNGKYNEIGVAVVKGQYNGQSVWIGVQEFGKPKSDCPSPDQFLKQDIDYNQEDLDDLSYDIDQKKKEIDNGNPYSDKYRRDVDDYNDLVAEYNNLVEDTKNKVYLYNSQVKSFNNCIAE